jgi:hypothetical protein
LHGDVQHEPVLGRAVPVVLVRSKNTRSRGRIVSTGPPSRWHNPTPSVTKIV